MTPQAIDSLRGASKRLAILNLIPEGGDRAARADEVYATFVQHLAAVFNGTVEPVPALPASRCQATTAARAAVRVTAG